MLIGSLKTPSFATELYASGLYASVSRQLPNSPPPQGASDHISGLTGLCVYLSFSTLIYFLPKSTSFPKKTNRNAPLKTYQGNREDVDAAFTMVNIDSIIGQLPSQHNLSQFFARFPEDSRQCQSAEHIWFNYLYPKLRSTFAYMPPTYLKHTHSVPHQLYP